MLRTPARRARRAITLLEAVIVLALVALVVVAVVPKFGSHRGAADDATAQQTVEAVVTTTQTALAGGSLYDLTSADGRAKFAALSAEYTISAPDTPSTGPKNASVTTSGTVDTPVAGVAVWSASSSTCWLLRREFAAPDGSVPTLHAVSHSQGSCTGASAEAMHPSGPAAGDNWSKPQRLP